MSLITLPAIVENSVTNYLKDNIDDSYSILKSFSTEDLTFPAIIVEANTFTELEPNCGVFSGKLGVGIITQIDDTETPLATHDAKVSEVYDLLQNLSSYFNAQTNGHLWGIYIEGFNQSREDRSLISAMEYTIKCQSMAL